MRTFHGYTLEDLQERIVPLLDMDGEIRLDTNLLQGWSSLNFLGYVDQVPTFVLKLPKSSETRNFDSLFLIHETLSKSHLCPKALYHGMLPDTEDLPIFVLEYVEGRVYDSPFELSEDDYWLLKETLDKLARITVPSVSKYHDAIEHLNAITRPLELRIYDYGRNLTLGLRDLFDRFITLSDLSRNRLEASNWTPVTIHGDLFERNIVFRDESVVLLDMEECCVSDKYYDSVYLFAQSYTGKTVAEESPFRGGCSQEHWTNLEILSLCSVIKWSLQRILDLELGLIECNLSRLISDDLVREYVSEKMDVLSALLYQ